MQVSVDSVSSNILSRDFLSVSLMQTEIFLDPVDEKPIAKDILRSVEISVPKQIPAGLAAAMEATAAAA